MATLVHQREMLPLHASAVSVAGRICAFLGVSGSGKSTLAAALNQRGHAIITDDVLSIAPKPSDAVAYPGAYRLRIAPEAAAALGLAPSALSAAGDALDKRVLYPTVDTRTAHKCMPMGCIFLLAFGRTLRTRHLRHSQAFKAIESQVYVNRTVLNSTRKIKVHVEACAHLARTVDVHYLERPRSLALLPEVTKLVEQICIAS